MRLRHFGSYMGVVLCACVLIGMLGLSRAINEIYEASRLEYQERMELAVEDLCSQQEILENVSFRIKSSALYRPFFTERNAYYETEVVEDILKYRDYSPLIDEYYLLQRETGDVYSPQGKLTFAQFAQYRLRVEEPWLDGLFSGMEMQILAHPHDADTLLFALPFRVQTDGVRTPDTCLIFLIKRAALAGRLERISALDPSVLTVYWRDFPLLGDPSILERETISVASQEGDWQIFSFVQPAHINQRLMDFRRYFILVLTLGTVFLLAMAALIAGRSYRPISRLTARLNIPQNASAEDIEAAVNALQDAQSYTKQQLQNDLAGIARQRREIAKQLLFARLNGMRDARLDAQMAEAGIALSHPWFCVVLVKWLDGKSREETVSSMAHALADGDMSLYPAGLYRAGESILLLNFALRGQLEDFLMVLRESLEVEGGGVALFAGDVCEDMGQITLSFVSAIARREAEFSGETERMGPMEAGWYDDRQVRLMMQALREGNSLKAQTCLDALCQMLREKYPMMALQRCIWADVGSQLLRTVAQMNVQLDPGQLHMLLMAVDTHSFQQQLSRVLEQAIAASNARTAQENQQMERNVVEYIQAHLFSPQFTIAEAADAFGISERKVGAIVKLATGLPYKEFIIRLRMERAKELLAREDCNVAQTGEAVGYNNIPYFIKTFRNFTGYTPGEYRKLFEEKEDAR